MNVLDPQGPIGVGNATILIDSVAIMLAIVVPTIVAIFAFAFWFRASNTRATYMPRWAHSGRIEMVVWSIPTLTIMLLGGVAWLGAHHLDPAKPIESDRKPLRIQAVSLDWKWLFLYPDQKIATVNTLTVPVGTPLQFELTSASVMNAFFIPQLGSMIYTMNGMNSRLNLLADKVGTYRGLSSQYSGDGFSKMSFEVNVVSESDFAAWTQNVANSDRTLDAAAYVQLAHPSTKGERTLYRLGDPHLFDAIVSHEIPPSPGPGSGPAPGSAAGAGTAPHHPASSTPGAGVADVR
jgi:cytochrome o ubiquinol oxidase subunit 2